MNYNLPRNNGLDTALVQSAGWKRRGRDTVESAHAKLANLSHKKWSALSKLCGFTNEERKKDEKGEQFLLNLGY